MLQSSYSYYNIDRNVTRARNEIKNWYKNVTNLTARAIKMVKDLAKKGKHRLYKFVT
jgi:hypothetical protein